MIYTSDLINALDLAGLPQTKSSTSLPVYTKLFFEKKCSISLENFIIMKGTHTQELSRRGIVALHSDATPHFFKTPFLIEWINACFTSENGTPPHCPECREFLSLEAMKSLNIEIEKHQDLWKRQLHFAMEEGDALLLQNLLQTTLFPEKTIVGFSLIGAVKYEHRDITERLINNPLLDSSHLKEALMLAIENNHIEIVELLTTRKDLINHLRPHIIAAQQNNQKEVLNILLEVQKQLVAELEEESFVL